MNWLDCAESLFLSCIDGRFDDELRAAASTLLTMEGEDSYYRRFCEISSATHLSGYEKFCTMACVAANRNRKVNELLCGCSIAVLQKLYSSDSTADIDISIDFGDTLKTLIFELEPSQYGSRLKLLSSICCYIEGNRDFMAIMSGYASMPQSFNTVDDDSRIKDYLSHIGQRKGKELLLLRGGDAEEMMSNLGAAALTQGYGILKADTQAMVRAGDIWHRVRELAGTVLITNALLCLTEADFVPEEDRQLLLRMIFAHFRFVAVISRRLTEFDLSESGCTVYRLEQSVPEAMRRLELWKMETQRYDLWDSRMLIPLADRFCFTHGQIAKTVETAGLAVEKQRNSDESFRKLQQAAMGIIGFSMGEYAREVHGKYSWKDIVIAEDCSTALHDACNRITYRTQVYDEWKLIQKPAYGNGVSMLFYGPPGTGKTMAAQVVAREVGCALYKIDLSQIMDKYVGESEKKLKEIFENASKANIMLLFDEADSLFSKRTEVGNANDRYANTQTAFLLQQIEEYDGVSVLTTNCAGSFDQAFKRRIQYFISFPMPDAQQRLAIWQRVIPKDFAKADQLNLEFLAEQFELSGSSIKAIATSAVFRAVGRDEKLSQEHLRYALREELLKQGRVYMKSDFLGYENT